VREAISTRFSVKYKFHAKGTEFIKYALRGFKSFNTFAIEFEENDLNGEKILNYF